MKSSVIKTLAFSCALVITPWLASAAEGGKGGGKHGAGDALQAAIEKLSLTDEQKAKIKPIMDKAAADRQEFQKAHAEELKTAREAKDKEKMHSLMAPLMEKRKAVLEEVKAILTDEQKKKLEEAMPAHGGHGKKNK